MCRNLGYTVDDCSGFLTYIVLLSQKLCIFVELTNSFFCLLAAICFQNWFLCSLLCYFVFYHKHPLGFLVKKREKKVWTVFNKICKMSIPRHFGTVWTVFWIKWEFSQNRALCQFKAPMMTLTFSKKIGKNNEWFRVIFEKVHFGTILGLFCSVLPKFDLLRKKKNASS